MKYEVVEFIEDDYWFIVKGSNLKDDWEWVELEEIFLGNVLERGIFDIKKIKLGSSY